MRNGMGFWRGALAMAVLVSGCSMSTMPGGSGGAQPSGAPARLLINSPITWGGQVRCGSMGCRMVVVEHENNAVVLHQLNGRTSRRLDKQPVAYHPDSAIWLSDDLVGAAVEASSSIDIFRVEAERLVRVHQAHVGFAPRDVVLVESAQGRYRMLATPYSGKEVAWVDWREDNAEAAKVTKTRWCEAPWHPVRVVRLPGGAGPGYATACLDDRRVVAVPDADQMGAPRVLASFNAVARQARPSPSGLWLYVALETGGRNARIHMESGELQWIDAPQTGAVAVAPLSDDLVVWSDDRHLYLQRLGPKGEVLETRDHQTSGFSTGLQWIDVDADGERDMVVYNSSGETVDVLFGPLWEQAKRRQ